MSRGKPAEGIARKPAERIVRTQHFYKEALVGAPAPRRWSTGSASSCPGFPWGGRRTGSRPPARRGHGREQLGEELRQHHRLVAARTGAGEAQVPVPEVALGAAALAEIALLAGGALVYAGGDELRSAAELGGQRVDIDIHGGLVAEAVRTHATGTAAEASAPRGERAAVDGADPAGPVGAVTGTVTHGSHDFPRRRLASFSRQLSPVWLNTVAWCRKRSSPAAAKPWSPRNCCQVSRPRLEVRTSEPRV